MKSINKKSEIKKHTKLKRYLIGSGISISAVCLLYVSNQPLNKDNDNKGPVIETTSLSNDSITCEGRDEYLNIYIEQMANIDNKKYDPKFIDIYKNKELTVIVDDDKKYDVDLIYLAKTEDDKDHYFLVEGEKKDLFTNESLDDRETYYTLTDSSIFYRMYQDGLINDEGTINISSDQMKEYLNTWDHDINHGIPEIEARYAANEEYGRRHGK